MSASQGEADVVIVGAGPVGLTLACGLALLGIDVRIIEKSGGTKTQPRAAVVWQRAEETWGLLGVMPRVLAEANKLAGIEVHHGGECLGSIELGGVPSEYPHPLILEQHITERLLAERLSELGVQVEWNTELVDLCVDAEGAVLQVRRGGERGQIAAGWVVGCEGSQSRVRERAGIAFPGRRRDNLQCMTIDAVPEWRYPEGDRSRGRFFLAPNVALGCFPLPGYDGHAYRFYAFTDDEHPGRDSGDPTVEEMRNLIARVADAPELALTLTEPRWLGRARFQDCIAETLRRGRAIVAGDSAHVWAPIAGHGMNTGIIGAGNLAWKLAAVVRGEAREGLLDTYTDEQTATAKLILRETRLDFVENIHSAPTLSLLAGLLPHALKIGAVRAWIDATLSSLSLSHHGKSLLADAFGEHAHLTTPGGVKLNIRPGDRFPYFELNAAFLARYDGWLLFLAMPQTCPSEEALSMTHALHEIAGQYQAKIKVIRFEGAALSYPQVIAIRPDSHVGKVAKAGNPEQLTTYLDRFLCRRFSLDAQRGIKAY